jgi:two-component system sensor histidine kinase BarA
MGPAVLVVEDSLMGREVLAGLLGHSGAEVVAVGSGEEAVAAAAGRPFDAILMDYELPGMDGCEATVAILARRPGTPVFGMTAHGDAAHRGACERAGMTGVYTKPVRADDIDRLMTRVVGRCCREAALRTLAGNERMCERVVAAFRAEAPRLLQQAAEALAAGDAARARRVAHTLHGSLRYFGSNDATAHACDLEAAAAEGALDRAAAILDRLAVECRRLDEGLTDPV